MYRKFSIKGTLCPSNGPGVALIIHFQHINLLDSFLMYVDSHGKEGVPLLEGVPLIENLR